MKKLFCPHCGQEMTMEWSLCGMYRFLDVYFGCKTCDKCWEVRDNHTRIELQAGELSQWLRDKEKEDQEKAAKQEQRKQEIEEKKKDFLSL